MGYSQVDPDDGELWNATQSFYNSSFIWASLDNFGGNNGLYGDFPRVHDRTVHVFEQSPTVSGVGITMEGIDQNPAYYTYVLDRGWGKETAQQQSQPQSQFSTSHSESRTAHGTAHGSTGVGNTTANTTVLWLQDWGLSRCGAAATATAATVTEAWGLLAETVYAAGQLHEMHHLVSRVGVLSSHKVKG